MATLVLAYGMYSPKFSGTSLSATGEAITAETAARAKSERVVYVATMFDWESTQEKDPSKTLRSCNDGVVAMREVRGYPQLAQVAHAYISVASCSSGSPGPGAICAWLWDSDRLSRR